ncbi:hypothetical protein F511_04146 [Dorcoceras hygrometricum]|uniref:Uncharacterized protein n=1 Tax=Dorcoceras hygrometricum TaxID=472368 RepID=A0A2Z7BPN1_9LAMI|nr:hypothetical protein F511_04146 [Dorcoceras hygrometricum]
MMLKRQESSLSSSRRIAASTPSLQETRHSEPIGCMSGIFKLFSKYQNSRKRLTFGRKREKDKDKSTEDSLSSAVEDKSGTRDFGLSIEINVPRSPSVPPEIQLPASEETGSISEKRRQLIRALEKCNEDLEGLRRIIQGVQKNDAAENRDLPGGKNEDSRAVNSGTENCAAVGTEAWAPVSGFAEARDTVSAAAKTPARLPPRRKPPTASKKPGEDDAEPIAAFVMKSRCSPHIAISPRRTTSSPKARTIEEVCKDIAWGEKREMGRIMMVLQDYICRDLVEEVVKELKSCQIQASKLPLDGCKRRLSF